MKKSTMEIYTFSSKEIIDLLDLPQNSRISYVNYYGSTDTLKIEVEKVK